MPRLIVPETRTEAIVDARVFLLARDGPAGLSIRAIGREARLSAASILHHVENRDRLLRVAARHTGDARLRAIGQRVYQEGVAAFLPAPGDDEDLITARAWLGWLELWRSEDGLANIIEDVRAREVLLLARQLDLPFSSERLVPLHALVDGLTVAVCAPVRPLPPTRAREILTAAAADVSPGGRSR